MPDGLAEDVEHVEGLVLRRAWPRSRDELVLEYVDETGAIVAGRWHRGDGVVRLQRDGADRRLVGLADLLRAPGATLVSHRSERRAVVRLAREGGTRYAKVVRPSRAAELIERAQIVSGLPGRPFGVPALESRDLERGVTVWSELPGTSLHERLADPERLVEAARVAGGVVRWLHDQETAGVDATHDAGAEIALLRTQVDRLAGFHPELHRRAEALLDDVCGRLASDASRPALLHRDLHDKQVLVGPDGAPGLLDFDTAALGEPALDVANLVVHLELRAAQGRCSAETASRAARAFTEAYEPDRETDARLDAWADATRLRLACVYAFRPRWRSLAMSLARPDAITARPSAPPPA